MPVMYNLRSSQRKKGTSFYPGTSGRNCYLRDYLGNRSPEAFNPKVCLERLKLLECTNIENSRFYLEKDRITIKQNKPRKSNTRYFLTYFCSFILILLCLIYCKDEIQFYGITIAKKFREIHPGIKSYFSEAVQVQKNYMKLLSNLQQGVRNKKDESKFKVSQKNFILKSKEDNFEIMKLVEDEFMELRSRNIFRNSTKTPKSFIEEQCLVDARDSLKTVFEENNLTDYALESLGAEIATVFDTEPYGTKTVKFFNFNVWPPLSHFLMKRVKYFSTNDANSILVPWKKPGDCWAFKGSRGRVRIKLSQKIFITAVTVDHIPKEFTLDGNIESAPKKFSVVGIEDSGTQMGGKNLGSYEYKSTGPASQTFLVEPRPTVPFGWVEVNIESNHGNANYTCVYKIRIHGHK